MLLRRRAGLKQEDVALALGRSLVWLRRMEHGKAPVEELLRYWGVR